MEACSSEEAVTRYLDGEVQGQEADALEAHVIECVRCQQRMQRTETIGRRMAKTCSGQPARDFMEEKGTQAEVEADAVLQHVRGCADCQRVTAGAVELALPGAGGRALAEMERAKATAKRRGMRLAKVRRTLQEERRAHRRTVRQALRAVAAAIGTRAWTPEAAGLLGVPAGWAQLWPGPWTVLELAGGGWRVVANNGAVVATLPVRALADAVASYGEGCR